MSLLRSGAVLVDLWEPGDHSARELGKLLVIDVVGVDTEFLSEERVGVVDGVATAS